MGLYGYARVSKNEQDLSLQIEALKIAGCIDIFTEKISGVKNLPEQKRLLDYLRPGDTLVVWKIDRLGRKTVDLLEFVNSLKERQIGFKSITENLDTSGLGGEFIFTIFAALAQLERSIIIERTRAGLQAARDQGRIGGRPQGLSPKYAKIAKMVKLNHKNGASQKELMEAFIIPSTNTLYRILNSDK